MEYDITVELDDGMATQSLSKFLTGKVSSEEQNALENKVGFYRKFGIPQLRIILTQLFNANYDAFKSSSWVPIGTLGQEQWVALVRKEEFVPVVEELTEDQIIKMSSEIKI